LVLPRYAISSTMSIIATTYTLSLDLAKNHVMDLAKTDYSVSQIHKENSFDCMNPPNYLS
jgi:hypothetical protein